MIDLTNTAKALDAFDAAYGPRESADDSELARAVGYAYGLDTSPRNTPEFCANSIRPGPRKPPNGAYSFVRIMVAKWRGQPLGR